MNPRYAILRTNRKPVEVEVMARAFRGVPGLTPYDAHMVCGAGDGILCRNLSAAQAEVLLTNLGTEAVQVELVEETKLPSLPTGRVIHRGKFTPEALLVDDLLKGQLPLPWEQVQLIAAGSVQTATFARKRTEWEEVHMDHLHIHAGIMIPIPRKVTRFEYNSKESSDWFLRADILLADSTTRYRIEAEHFDFAASCPEASRNLAGDFCLFVRELARYAPKAMLSRGAAAILADPPEFVYFPHKKSYEDELIWTLWRNAQGQIPGETTVEP